MIEIFTIENTIIVTMIGVGLIFIISSIQSLIRREKHNEFLKEQEK